MPAGGTDVLSLVASASAAASGALPSGGAGGPGRHKRAGPDGVHAPLPPAKRGPGQLGAPAQHAARWPDESKQHAGRTTKELKVAAARAVGVTGAAEAAGRRFDRLDTLRNMPEENEVRAESDEKAEGDEKAKGVKKMRGRL